ncbi:cold shock protein CspA [Candidatus Phytoplasma solani]|uniref:cold-shock protein n=1 Tax=Candidatus Phytoplasma solani TaxID=69896 RepID=UPI0032DB7BC7
MQDKKHRGTCKWFAKDKGFGFILSSDQKEIFVHWRSILTEMLGRKTLNEGDQVEFSIEESDRGPQAKDVIIINE